MLLGGVTMHPALRPVMVVIALAISVVAAWGAYRWIEFPAMQWAKRFSYRRVDQTRRVLRRDIDETPADTVAAAGQLLGRACAAEGGVEGGPVGVRIRAEPIVHRPISLA